MLRTTPLLAALALLLGACSTYDSRYQFRPRPAEVRFEVPGAEDATVRTLASIIGVRNPDRDAGVPAQVEVRLRLEAPPAHEARLDLRSLRLLTGDLEPLPAPVLEPDGTIVAPPGGAATATAYFPFPGDGSPADFDLAGLNLRWTVTIDGAEREGSATFERLRYRDDRSYGRVGIGVGTGWHQSHFWYHRHAWPY